VIDITMIVAADSDVLLAIARFAAIGYVHQGNLGVEGREASDSPRTLPAHHLYLCPRQGLGLMNHLTFATTCGHTPKPLARMAISRSGWPEGFDTISIGTWAARPI
jgi:hypothetical protein